ncbi:1256_t:CDS:10 [Ambispora leptoticha]|uniref:1256_t:CDS:1 n=1 Tax=Ambispora leptoticha TaxID=144679 RepID=A0A9N9B5D4_9GLOM|nr:1256_t:CDS:10 [Ambispora leptoticha]
MANRRHKGIRISIDRGGTFTDCYGSIPVPVSEQYPNGRREVVIKLLSVDPQNYPDAPREGIRRILEHVTGKPHPRNQPVDTSQIESIRMGTTVATNALLERKGEPCALLITKGNQSRPKIFDLSIRKLEVLYHKVIEVDERVVLIGDASHPSNEFHNHNSLGILRGISGEYVSIIKKPDLDVIRRDLETLYAEGIRSVAICLMHSYTYSEHERLIGQVASEIGFTHVSLSSTIMPMIKIVPRGTSSTADAYLTPCIKKYIEGFISGFDENLFENARLEFMQSDGGLVPVNKFSGFRAILSGPAGGVVGYGLTSFSHEEKIPVIDVSRYDGRFEHVFETTTAGVTIQAPQLDINTVAAGGGSRLFFRNGMFVVGPESAGAHPGPACYRKNGPLTVTDANLILGRLIPEYFPKIFGPNEDLPLDIEITRLRFEELAKEINAFVVANEKMCRPIRSLTEAKGYDTSKHILACFGGAGGQHACAIAHNLGIKKILIHRHSSILSAYGLSLADVVHETQEPCAEIFSNESLPSLQKKIGILTDSCFKELKSQGFDDSQILFETYLNLRYQGTDFGLMTLKPSNSWEFDKEFAEQYKQEFGFNFPDREILVDDIRIRGIGRSFETANENVFEESQKRHLPNKPQSSGTYSIYFEGGRVETPVYLLENLEIDDKIFGPAMIIDANSTILVTPQCNALITSSHIVITVGDGTRSKVTTELDPIQLSIFGHRFMSIAEQMGRTLQKTAVSTNIKERLDFSCALFGPDGGLVANAPHIPVHLGSLSYAVKFQMEYYKDDLEDGDVILTNHPQAGGSHLPDISVITPVFNEGKIVFFVASRGHHADIGGILPGSMPPHSKELYQEGAAVKSFKLVSKGKFDIDGLTDILLRQPAKYPGCSGTRCLRDNVSDLKAQVAANHKGILLVKALIQECGLDVVQAYMMYIRKNAELSVRELLKTVHRRMDGKKLEAVDYMDDGSPIRLQININEKEGTAIFDFHGTGAEVYGNTNAPPSVTYSAIIYCLRCLIAEEIPLNQGCLSPIDVRIPPKSFLNPSDKAAVVGGNVLTSQRLVDVILKAFDACAASQGDCNNLTFGKGGKSEDGKKVVEGWGYYETIAGGSGAGSNWDGQSGVHTHMTNTRITDPEILERRYDHAIILREFSLRKGSGGAGLHRGGDGVIRDLEFREPLKVSILSERRVFHPYGLKGGKDGACGLNIWIRKGENGDERVLNLGGKNSVEVNPGDRIIICTPGGGGWGPPSSDTKDMDIVE